MEMVAEWLVTEIFGMEILVQVSPAGMSTLDSSPPVLRDPQARGLRSAGSTHQRGEQVITIADVFEFLPEGRVVSGTLPPEPELVSIMSGVAFDDFHGCFIAVHHPRDGFRGIDLVLVVFEAPVRQQVHAGIILRVVAEIVEGRFAGQFGIIHLAATIEGGQPDALGGGEAIPLGLGDDFAVVVEHHAIGRVFVGIQKRAVLLELEGNVSRGVARGFP